MRTKSSRAGTMQWKSGIIVHFINELYEPTERLLTIATADNGDAATLTDTIIEEFTTAGLSTEKVIVCMTVVKDCKE